MFQPIAAHTGIALDEGKFWAHSETYKAYLRQPYYLAGRRGSGKTTFLNSLLTSNQRDHVVLVSQHDIYLPVLSALEGIPSGGRLPEATAKLWERSVTVQAMKSVLDKHSLPLCHDYLGKQGLLDETLAADSFAWALIESLRTKQGGSIGTLADFLSRIHSVEFEAAKAELINSLLASNERVIVAMDNLETYSRLPEAATQAHSGLFNFIGASIAHKSPIVPSICLPLEYFDQIVDLSSDPLRDIPRFVQLTWTEQDLLGMAALRIQSASSLDEEIDPSDVDALYRTIAQAFPHNEVAQVRSIISHFLDIPPLNPRHFLAYLSRAVDADSKYGLRDALLDSLTDIQMDIRSMLTDIEHVNVVLGKLWSGQAFYTYAELLDQLSDGTYDAQSVITKLMRTGVIAVPAANSKNQLSSILLQSAHLETDSVLEVHPAFRREIQDIFDPKIRRAGRSS